MRKWGFFLLFISGTAFAVVPVISPSTPIVNQGATIQFSETQSEAGVWSCSATNSTGGVTACSGSINSGSGLYTAPSSVTAQHVYGGMQMLPNNDVYNTRIDSMPVHPNNFLYLATVNQGGGPSWSTDFPINYVLPTGSSDMINFFYSTDNNGTFEVPSFPTARAEHGWFSALQLLDDDHHVIMVDTVTSNFSEMYQYYPNCITTAASVASNVATLTCSKNPQTGGFIVGTRVAVGGFTGADTYFNGSPLTISAVTSTSISYPLVHANATASTNGAAGKNWSNDSTGLINSQGGILYSSMTYVLPPISTDAAGQQLQPLVLGLQEFEQAYISSGSINHAFRNTFGQGYLASSSTWPSTTFATDGSTVPFGSRMRLKGSFDTSTYTSYAQILMRALKQYGSFVTDGGQNWPMNAELTRWPKPYYDSFTEVGSAGKSFHITNTSLTSNVATITAPNDYVAGQSLTSISGTSNGAGAFNVSDIRVSAATPTQFSFAFVHSNIGSAADSGTAFSKLSNYMEFVDESGIVVSTNSGLTTNNREIVRFTRTSDSATANKDVALQGPAINFANDVTYIMAGTPAQQLTVLNNYGGFTCSMSPSTGTLTSGCLYTPPSTVSITTTTLITATSIVNSSASAVMTLTVFPSTGIYVIPSQTSDYLDSAGNTWTSRSGMSYTPDTQGCCSCDNSSHFTGTDSTLFSCVVGVVSTIPGDTQMSFLVPNGTYRVNYNYGTQNTIGSQFIKYSINSNEIDSKIDPSASAGGQFKRFTSADTVVTNNQLLVGIWNMNDLGAPISSLSISSTTALPTPTSSEKMTGGCRFSGRIILR